VQTYVGVDGAAARDAEGGPVFETGHGFVPRERSRPQEYRMALSLFMLSTACLHVAQGLQNQASFSTCEHCNTGSLI
jgi:hypothetical protein